MDILTHTLSGLAAGAVAAGFSKRGPSSQVAIVALSGLGGALPDIDAATFLLEGGAYSAKFWYSHHGFFHSLAAAILFGSLVALIAYMFRADFRTRALLFTGFVGGFVLHLLEDVATPAASWGGVRLFFPAKTYIGGTGQVWWWNNYDIFLIAGAVFTVCAGLLFVRRRGWPRWVSVGVFVLGCVLCVIQVCTREADYAYTGHTEKYGEFEAASKAEQRKILGKRLSGAMEWFDRKLPVNF